MILRYVIFTVECGRCQTSISTQDGVNADAFKDYDAAAEAVKDEGWHTIGEDVFCPKCAKLIIDERKKDGERGR